MLSINVLLQPHVFNSSFYFLSLVTAKKKGKKIIPSFIKKLRVRIIYECMLYLNKYGTRVPLHLEFAPLHLKAKTKVLDRITENLELIEPHQAFFILKNCLSIPKFTYLLRSGPCFKCKEELEAFDTAIRINTKKICNVTFEKDSWSQAFLPIRHGGFGLYSAADLSLPCFLSSSFACQGLINMLLPSLTLPHGEVINATDAWSALHDSSPRQKETQWAWDDLACKDVLAELLDTPNPWNHCRLLPTQKSHTAT